MSFTKLFQKSNLSVNQLRGNAITGVVQRRRGDLVTVDTGLNTSTVCFQSELKAKYPIIRNTNLSRCILGIERMEMNGEAKIMLPNHLDQLTKRKLVWTELTQKLRSLEHNRVLGFILNSMKGGYAIALAGHIAFLPKSLRRKRKKAFHGQWRLFSILSMNAKIGNIVVKEIVGNTTELKQRLKAKTQNHFIRSSPVPLFETKKLRLIRPIGKRVEKTHSFNLPLRPKPTISYASSKRKFQTERLYTPCYTYKNRRRPLLPLRRTSP